MGRAKKDRRIGDLVICTRCRKLKPFTVKYFRRDGEKLRMPCKACQQQQQSELRGRMTAARREKAVAARGSRSDSGGTRKQRTLAIVRNNEAVLGEAYDEREQEAWEPDRWWKNMVYEILCEMYPRDRRKRRKVKTHG